MCTVSDASAIEKLRNRLGAGESEVITLAAEKGRPVLLDDLDFPPLRN